LVNGSGRIDGHSEIRVKPTQHVADSDYQFLTRCGEGHWISPEDIEANICFKLLNLTADIWLRNV
jgi:hypothetical protein